MKAQVVLWESGTEVAEFIRTLLKGELWATQREFEYRFVILSNSFIIYLLSIVLQNLEIFTELGTLLQQFVGNVLMYFSLTRKLYLYWVLWWEHGKTLTTIVYFWWFICKCDDMGPPCHLRLTGLVGHHQTSRVSLISNSIWWVNDSILSLRSPNEDIKWENLPRNSHCSWYVVNYTHFFPYYMLQCWGTWGYMGSIDRCPVFATTNPCPYVLFCTRCLGPASPKSSLNCNNSLDLKLLRMFCLLLWF